MSPVANIQASAYHVGEKKLRKIIEELFDVREEDGGVVYHARKAAGLEKSTRTVDGKIIYHELDVWIPKHNIGFEYQVFLFYFFKNIVFLCFVTQVPLILVSKKRDI